MTGDTGLNNRGGDLLLQLKPKGPRMLDKAVQFNSTESSMDGSGLDGGGDGTEMIAVTVAEINSPGESSNGPTSHIYSNTFRSPSEEDTGFNSPTNNTDVDGFNADNNDVLYPDHTDTATMPLSGFRFKDSMVECTRPESESVDEIKKQSFVALNNCLSLEEKPKEFAEPKDESNCALDCLSFTIQCCECTIL